LEMIKPLSALAIGMVLLSSRADAWRVHFPATGCPGITPHASWREYLANPAPGRVGNQVGIEFRRAKEVNDPASLDNLPTNACYHLMYVTHPLAGHGPPNTYFSSRIASHQNGPDVKVGLPGNPLNGEINVHGILLTFNELGEVINHAGVPVGVLMCYTSDECGSY